MKRLNRNVELAVIAIDQQIDRLTTYGRRVQTVKAHGYRIAWSNNQARWWRYYSAEHGHIILDANELFIIGHTKGTLEHALPLLKQHPLYAYSREER